MSIIALNTNTTGLTGQTVNPRRCTMITTDNLAAVTTAGYLNNQNTSGNPIFPTDVFEILYSFNTATQAGTFGIFTVSYSASTGYTLTLWGNPGDVLLPVVSGHIATFNGTTGQIGDLSTPAVHGGNIQAGLSGTAGTLASFPATASKGSLLLVGVANTGNTNTTISNAPMGQASVISIPDPASATANFTLAVSALVSGNLVQANGTAGLLVDQGFAMKSVAGAAAAGGAAAQSFTDAFCTTGSNVIGNWNTQANAASVLKIVPGDGSFVVTSSADAGVGTFNYIITK